MADYYYHIIKCDCDNEWLVIGEQKRVINNCEDCGLIHDVWLDDYFMSGTLEEAVAYLEESIG
jgi:hypothetical protein